MANETTSFTIDMLPNTVHFKNAYELLNLRAFKISRLYKKHIFQCMGKIFYVEFQRYLLVTAKNVGIH